jgi:hypothetical protein
MNDDPINDYVTAAFKSEKFLEACSELLHKNNPATRMYRDNFLLEENGEAVVPAQAALTLKGVIEMELKLLKDNIKSARDNADLWGTVEHRQMCENIGRLATGLMVAAGMTAAALSVYDNVLETIQEGMKETGLSENELVRKVREA